MRPMETGRGLPPPPKPKPANLSTGNNPRGVSITARPPSTAASKQVTARARSGGSDAATSGPGYGSAEANQYKKTPAYHQAVQHVFKAQPIKQKAAIIRGVLKGNGDPETARAIHQAFNSLPIYEKTTLAKYLPHNAGITLSKIANIFSPSTVYGSSGKTGENSIMGTVTPFEKGTFGRAMALNTLKDAVNLPAEAFATAGTIGGDIVHHNVAKGLSDITSPFVQMAEHPLKAIVNHPLDTYLALTGALHGATRPIAGAVRAAAPESTLGRLLSRERPQVQLTGKLTHTEPHYSQYPLIQAAQKIAERRKFRKTETGSLVAKRQAVEDRLTALETSREAGMIERVRRAGRDEAHSRRLKAVRSSTAVRVAKQTRRALKSGREAATIRGAEHLALLPDATIRSAKTAAEDVRKYVKMVSANRADLLNREDMLKEHDKNVAALNKFANDLERGKIDKQALFKASNAYARDYNPVQKIAQRFGQFGTRTADMLNRRVLAHYAITHMGAKYEEAPAELARYDALKQEVLNDPNLSFGQRMAKLRAAVPQGKLLRNGEMLSNKAIREHMKANGVKHELAFTSDKPHPDSAFYVSSERRPLPESARNTYFAYTHGLTDTSHEALLRQHVRMQGVVDAHKAQNRLLEQIAIQKTGGGYWKTYREAKDEAQRLGGNRYAPIRVSQPFHPQEALDMALEGVHPATVEEETQLHGLDLSSRLEDSGPGQYAVISKVALQRLEEHRSAITPNLAQRAFNSVNNQFRKVALSTSAKHIPGVATEQVIRDIASGTGLFSWIVGRRIASRLPEEIQTRLKGGQLAGATQMAQRHFIAERYLGTSLYRPLKAFEGFMEKPGPRQLGTAWRAWTTFAIQGTKKVLEEQHQVADIGKSALIDFASEHGPFFKAMRLQGRMADDAAHGFFDPAKERQFRAYTERIRGRWNDLTPHGQMTLMYSPFGLWWLNSVRWLARAPIDQPVKTGIVAAATVGTEKQRQANGLDMFSSGRLPDYMQGSIPIGGGKVLAQNYYSPFGVANDPAQTLSSLAEPWFTPVLLAGFGVDWKGKPINSPGNPHGDKAANTGQKIGVALNSILSSFIPLYTKAEQIAAGGASEYDTSGLATGIQTKTPGGGPAAGARKALTPYRSYKIPAPKASAAGGGAAGVSIPGASSAGVSIPGGSSAGGVSIP